jgi:hypothetical protein
LLVARLDQLQGRFDLPRGESFTTATEAIRSQVEASNPAPGTLGARILGRP